MTGIHQHGPAWDASRQGSFSMLSGDATNVFKDVEGLTLAGRPIGPEMDRLFADVVRQAASDLEERRDQRQLPIAMSDSKMCPRASGSEPGRVPEYPQLIADKQLF